MSSPCAVPSCAESSRAVVCIEHKRKLPAWLTHSRGRNVREMAHDVRAFCGSKDPEDAPRGFQFEQSGIWFGRRTVHVGRKTKHAQGLSPGTP